jgi:hypothetical protein
VDCQFCLEIYAPQGLRGIEPHLGQCALALSPWQSGYNGKVILRALREADFVWEMDSSDDAVLFASGSIAGEPRAGEARLRTLSTSLRMAGFRHRILLDDPAGNPYASIEHEWSPELAP